MLRGKATWNLDASLNKDFDLPGRAGLRLHVTMSNVFNHPVWGTPDWNDNPNITSTTFDQTTGPLTAGNLGGRQMYIRTEIMF